MAWLHEHLSGGLVQTRPEHTFDPGEMLLTDNCVYRHDSPSLWAAQGRLATAVTGVDPVGLVIAKFDSGKNYWIYQNPVASLLSVYEIPSGSTALNINTYTQGDTLSAAVFNNQYFIFNGAHANLVINHTNSAGLTSGSHGLDPVIIAPGLSITTGSWPLGTAGLNKYYEYWVSESYTLNGSEVESDTDATAVATSDIIDATSDAVSIALPTKRNSAATHFNIYRSAGKTLKSDKQFPVGVRIAQVVIGTTDRWLDGGAASTSQVFPSTATSATWTNPSNVTANDGTNATVTTSANTSDVLTTSNYSFAGVADAINGVEVEIEAQRSAIAGALLLAVSLDGGTTFSSYRAVNVGTSLAVYTAGGAQDLWGLVSPAASALSLQVRIAGSGAVSGSVTFTVDYVRARIHHTAAQSVGVIAFPTVAIEIAGVLTAVGANGKPATASTGDVLNGSLVTNDIAHPSFVRWTLPGKPHAQPSIYFDDIETDDNDVVTCIRTVGQRVAVGMTGQLIRYDFMPSEDDAVFNTGAARAQVDPSFGIVGPNAACVYTGPDGRATLAFVSRDGLRGSDLFSTWPLCPDIDWRSILSTTSVLHRIVLINNPRNYELILYYPGGDATGLMCKKLTLSYAPMHLKNGKYLKASGPCNTGTVSTEGVTGAACAPSIDTGYSWSVYEAWRRTSGGSGDGDQIWRVVDRGTASATTAAPSWRTRRIYALEPGGEWVLDAAIMHAYGGSAVAFTPTVTGTLIGGVTGAGALAAVNLPTTSGHIRLGVARSSGGAIDIAGTTTNTNVDMRFDTLHLKGNGWGDERAAT